MHVDRAVDELWDDCGPATREEGRPRRGVQAPGRSRKRAWCFPRAWPATRLRPGQDDALDAARFEALSPARPGRALGGSSRRRRRRHCGRHWRSGGARRWRTSATSALHSPRSRASTTSVSPASADRVDADLACGAHAEVVASRSPSRLNHPLRERIRGQQMLALYRCGRQADALEAYRSTYEALVDGLGIEPSPALRALESAILRHHSARGRPPPPAARPPCRCEAPGDVRVRAARARRDAHLDAESLRPCWSAFTTPPRATCARYGGTAAELRNDAVLLVFGAPLAHEDDAQRALRAAGRLVARTAPLPFGLRRAAASPPARRAPGARRVGG